MRSVLIALILMAIMIPQVSAVGIATLEDYSGGFEMDEGDSVDLSFSLRGDDVDNTVGFFIYSLNNGGVENGLEFEGGMSYDEIFHLSAYENEDVEIEMDAVRPGIYTVIWGFSQEGGDSVFDIDSYTESRFVVEVDDVDGYDIDDFDVVVDASDDSGSSGSSGGGGGGGGAYIPPPAVVENDDSDSVPGPEREVVLADVSTQGSALNEIAVDDSEDVVEEVGVSANPLGVSSEDGKSVLVGVMILGFIAIVFTLGAASRVGKGDDS